MKAIATIAALALIVLGVGIWGAHGFDDPVEWAELMAGWPWPELPHGLPC